MIIWNNKIDDKYPVEVDRTAPYQGTLKVFSPDNSETPVYQREVTIAYNAPFGPDAGDVSEWGTIACDAVDDYERRGRAG